MNEEVKDEDVELKFRLAQARHLGLVFQEAVKQYFNFYPFVTYFLNSIVFKRYHEDATIFSQSPRYILTLFKEELSEKNIVIAKLDDIAYEDLEPAYWLGYLYSRWKIDFCLPNEVISEYDIEWIYNRYDALHTVSIKVAIEKIREDCLKHK